MSKTYIRKGLAAGNHSRDHAARREAAMADIRELLAGQALSSRDIAQLLEMKSATVYGYLVQMQDEGYVCKTGHLDARGRQMWAQDDAPEKQAGDHSRRAFVVPARQMGIQRHWMDVALFGPAAATQQ